MHCRNRRSGGVMNVELLRKIAAVIQEKPTEFDMSHWHSSEHEIFGKLSKGAKACGTTHCIAGWAHLIDGRYPRAFTMDAARKILGLTKDQAELLFQAESWP